MCQNRINIGPMPAGRADCVPVWYVDRTVDLWRSVLSPFYEITPSQWLYLQAYRRLGPQHTPHCLTQCGPSRTLATTKHTMTCCLPIFGTSVAHFVSIQFIMLYEVLICLLCVNHQGSVFWIILPWVTQFEFACSHVNISLISCDNCQIKSNQIRLIINTQYTLVAYNIKYIRFYSYWQCIMLEVSVNWQTNTVFHIQRVKLWKGIRELMVSLWALGSHYQTYRW